MSSLESFVEMAMTFNLNVLHVCQAHDAGMEVEDASSAAKYEISSQLAIHQAPVCEYIQFALVTRSTTLYPCTMCSLFFLYFCFVFLSLLWQMEGQMPCDCWK